MRFSQLDRVYVYGLVGVVIAFIGCVGLYIVGIRWLGTSDSLRHFDYAWQLSHGTFPVFDEGTTVPIIRGGKNSWVGDYQFVTHHPPLYYALIAPTTRLFSSVGQWEYGVLAARLITLAISIGCVVSFAWAGLALGASRLQSLAMAAFGASYTPFVSVAGDILNDALVVLASCVSIALVAEMVRDGPNRRRIVLLAVASAVGMSTKATFIGVLLVCLAAVAIAFAIHADRHKVKAFARGTLCSAAIAAFVALCIGWFYYRNYLVSGHWYRANPQSWVAEVQGRVYKDLWKLISGSYEARIYKFMPEGLYGRGWRGWILFSGLPINELISWIVSIFTIAMLLFAGAKYGVEKIRYKNLSGFDLIIAMLLLIYLAEFSIQLRHATGYGVVNPRYMLPAIVPLAFAVAFAFTRFSSLSSFLLMGLLGAGWAASSANVVWTVAFRFQKSDANDFFDYLEAVSRNGFNVGVVYVLLAMVVFGFIVQVRSIFRLRRSSFLREAPLMA